MEAEELAGVSMPEDTQPELQLGDLVPRPPQVGELRAQLGQSADVLFPFPRIADLRGVVRPAAASHGVVLGGSLALAFSPLVTHALRHVPVLEAADASGLFTTTVQLGQAIGVAVFGSVFLTLAAHPAPHASGHALATTLYWLAALLASPHSPPCPSPAPPEKHQRYRGPRAPGRPGLLGHLGDTLGHCARRAQRYLHVTVGGGSEPTRNHRVFVAYLHIVRV